MKDIQYRKEYLKDVVHGEGCLEDAADVSLGRNENMRRGWTGF